MEKTNTSFIGGLNLSLLQNATTATVDGRSCLVIPIEDNPSLFVGRKGIYLDISIVETPGNMYGHTHFVKADIGSAKRQNFSREDYIAHTPILGNLKVLESKEQEPAQEDSTSAVGESTDDDLPW